MTRRLLVGLVVLAACGKKDTPPPQAVAATAAVVDVTVIPMDGERELAHQTVLVDGTRIVAIGPVGEVAVPAAAQRIDGAGKWLIPGLIDAHVHFNEARDAILYVANGVTTVRNMWGNPSTLEWRARAQKNDPAWIGPSIYTAGQIVDGNPPVWPTSAVIETAEQARAEIASEKAAGYDFVKVYENLTPEVYEALRAAAKDNGLRLAGHAPAALSLPQVLAGQASIEHLTGYARSAQDATSRAKDLTGDERFAEVVAHLDESKLGELARMTAAAKVANCPTLVVLERVSQLDHPEALQARPENKYVSAMTLAGWDPKADFRFHDAPPERFALMRKEQGFYRKVVKALQAAGAPVLAGTDTPNPFVVPGFALHDELVLLVGAGLTPYQALAAATVTPAHWLGSSAGEIRVGAAADLVLLDADPLLDIAATTKRAGVMLRGRWFPQAELATKLEAVVAPADPFAGLAPPAIDPKDGETVFAGVFVTSVAGKPVGKERLAIARAKDGARVIVAQAVSDSLATVRLELDGKGRLISIAHEKDGKRTTAKLAGDKLVIDGATEVVSPDLLLDTDFVATMIPFADRAAPKAKTTVVGRTFPDKSDLSYTFDRTAGTASWGVLVKSRFGDAPGTYEVDDEGFPRAVSVKTGFGELAVTRE